MLVQMGFPARLLALAALLGLAGCAAQPEQQWMKVGERYTVAEFRQDVAACTHGGKLDGACMRERGWVTMTAPPKPDKPPDPRTGH
jgi:hypothetical protein